MTPTQLRNIATAAYGKDWKYPLADDTAISRAMLWRYQHGHTRISDEIRERVIKACKRFPIRKRSRITFEYVLLAGVNDSPQDARELAKLVASVKCKVNLIPLLQDTLTLLEHRLTAENTGIRLRQMRPTQ